MGADWDFDLLLENTEDGYRASVLRSPAGTAVAPIALPFKPKEHLTLVQQLMADPGKDEARRAEQFRLARTVGGRMFDTVFHGSILEVWHASWQRAYAERVTLHVHVRMDDDLPLRTLPWEYLYDATRDEFIALSAHTPLVRYQERAHQMLPLPVEPPLRVLVVMAGPEGYPPLAVGQEWRNLIDAVDYLAADRRMLFERLPRPTLLDLQRRLRQQTYHIVHFIGFSVHDPQTQSGVLLFEDEMGRGRFVSGQHLGSLLSDCFSVRLAVVSSRNAARTAGLEPAAQVSEEMVRRNVPAAIFQPSKLLDKPSLAFVHELYANLADFQLVDVAMAEARRAIELEESGAGWGLPQLASRIADGRLFVRKQPTPPAPPKPRLNLRSVFTPRTKS